MVPSMPTSRSMTSLKEAFHQINDTTIAKQGFINSRLQGFNDQNNLI